MIGLAAVLWGTTVFVLAVAFLAPRPVTADSHDDDLQLGERTPSNPDSMFEKYVRPALRNFLPNTPLGGKMRGPRRDKVVELLVRSGNPWNLQPEEFRGLIVLSSIVGAILGLAYGLSGVMPIGGPYGGLALGALLGYTFPKSRLTSAKNKRQRDVSKGLPDAIDLIRVCMNAGMPFPSALEEVCRRMPDGVVREEFTRVSNEIQAGTTMSQALHDLARRAPSDQIEQFSRAILQGQELGTDISKTLESQAAHAREDYEAAIDQLVAKLSGQLMGVIVATVMPAFMVVIIAPNLSQLGTVI